MLFVVMCVCTRFLKLVTSYKYLVLIFARIAWSCIKTTKISLQTLEEIHWVRSKIPITHHLVKHERLALNIAIRKFVSRSHDAIHYQTFDVRWCVGRYKLYIVLNCSLITLAKWIWRLSYFFINIVMLQLTYF